MVLQRSAATLAATLSILILPPLHAQQDKPVGIKGETVARSASGGRLHDRPRVEIRTELGTLVVELYNETPLHRDNFLKLAREHYYDSLLWHRVIPAFMVQGGDPGSKGAEPGAQLGNGGPEYTIPAEILPQFIHKKGVLAAARQSDQMNPEQMSSGSQFYIVQGKSYTAQDLEMIMQRGARSGKPVTYSTEQIAAYTSLGGAPHLDGGYTAFGEVVQGLELIDKIAAVDRDAADRPLADIHMWMRVLE